MKAAEKFDIKCVSVNHLNTLHMEYRARFKVEFHLLLEQLTFSEVIFRNHQLLFSEENATFVQTLRHCFGQSFEGMALCLSRLWEHKANLNSEDDLSLISIPMLATYFDEHYFGCHGLRADRDDRKIYERLFEDPIRARLRSC